MKAVLQRVSKAEVSFEGGAESIGPGLLILLGVGRGDGEADARWLADKVAELRIFSNEQGKFDLSLLDTGGEALVISQFTLHGDCRKGRRPDFAGAAEPTQARPLYERFIEFLRGRGVRCRNGRFAAKMSVELRNEGPVTLCLESPSEPAR